MKINIPSYDAIKTSYEINSENQTEKIKSFDSLKNSIENLEYSLAKLASLGRLHKYEIRRTSSFPLSFYAIFDEKICLMGKYFKEPLREKTVALDSRAWIENDSEIIQKMSEHFESFWKSLHTT